MAIIPSSPTSQSFVTGHSEMNVQKIPMIEIHRDGQNHRIENSTDIQKLQQLADSLRQNGQQQPVQVFEYPQTELAPKGCRYLLAFGFRRCAAAELNGWTHITAVVNSMPVLADGAVDRLTIERVRSIENLQRENLNPIEECVLVEQLAQNLPAQIEGNPTRQEDGRLTDEAIRFLARSIGRTEAWIRDRLYLSRLSPAVKQKVMEGRLFLIYAREIAKLADHAEQERLAGMCEADVADGHCHTTIHQVRRYVSERQNSLRGVPWHLDKAFPKHKAIVGACSTCPYNSSNDKQLFEHDEQAAPEGFCLRPCCFEAKRNLTDKAVEVAVAKIVKEKKPATEGTAVEVAAEFVKPGRVARQAKKHAEPKPAEPQQKKVEYWDTPEYKARMALQTAETEWQENANHTLTDALRAQPGRLVSLVMLVLSGRIGRQMTEKEVAKIQEAIRMTVKPSWQNVLQLEKRAVGRKQFDLRQIINLKSSESLVQALAKSYGVEMASFPKLEEFLPKYAALENKVH